MDERVERIHRMVEAWNDDDIEAAVELVDPDIVLDFRVDVTFPGIKEVYRGRDEFREWWGAMKEPFEYFRTEPIRFILGEDAVVSPVRFEAKGRSSGVDVNLAFFNVWTFRDGLIVRFEAMSTLEQALESASLSE